MESFSREIIYFAADRGSLHDAELHFIKEFDAVQSPMFYNISRGGEGGRFEQSERTRRKRSARMMGHPVSDKARDAARENGRRSSQDPEARKKQAAAISGKNHFRAKAVRINGVDYPTITAAARETGKSSAKIWNIVHGIPPSPKSPTRRNPRSQKVTMNGIEYPSIRNAARAVGVSSDKINSLRDAQ